MKTISRPLKIFFCDLTYDTIILVSDTIPINIGFIASIRQNRIIPNKRFTKKLKNNAKFLVWPNILIKNIKKQTRAGAAQLALALTKTLSIKTIIIIGKEKLNKKIFSLS